MAPEPRILRAGLTGGIASGKSTVAGFLSELGAVVVDADRIAHEIMEPGGIAYDGVVERFGREILDGEGRIVRPLLAQIVFNDPAGLSELNAIVHPKVRAVAEQRMLEAAGSRNARIGVFDAALLIESGTFDSFDRLIVVSCARETQLRRLALRGLSARDAAARVNAQAPLEDKLTVADYVIDTEGTLPETRARAEEVYRTLLEDWAIRP